MKNQKYYRSFRTTLAVIALGAAGLFVYQEDHHSDPVVAAPPIKTRANQRDNIVRTSPLSKPQESLSDAAIPAISKEIPSSHGTHYLFQEFNDWAVTYSNATPVEQQQMLAHGEIIVKQRHEQMADLIEKSPQVALDEADALSPLAREALPESLKAQLEQPVNARGDLRVMAYVGKNVAPYARFATLGDEEYAVFPAGENEILSLESNRSLLGIKLSVRRVTTGDDGKQYPRVDNLMALRQERVRVLSTEEVTVALKSAENGSEPACEVSAKNVAMAQVPAAIETGGDTKWMCEPDHATAWLKSPAGIEAAGIPKVFAAFGGPGEGSFKYPSIPPGWSTGDKNFLVGKFRCADQATYPYTNLSTIVQSMFDQVRIWSYGKIYFSNITYTPIFTLPRTAAQYKYEPLQYSLRNDANAILNQYYNLVNYSFYAVCAADTMYNRDGGADTGGKYMEIGNPANWIFQHELGHNLGLPHANLWAPSTSDPIGPGSWNEYGGSNSSMGANWASYNTMDRFYIRWLTLNDTHDLASRTNGTYTIYDPDVSALTTGRKYTIRIPRSDGSFYFVEFRPRPTEFTNKSAVDVTTQNGIRILRTSDAAQLDLTPQSAGNQFDGALVAGKEFYDSSENIAIKAIAKGGSGANQYFQVQVIFNRATVTSGRTYMLRSRANGGLIAGVANYSGENSAPVTQQNWEGYPNQKWVLMKVDASNYKLINANSGKALTIGGFSKVNGGLAEQYQYVDSYNQKWQIVSTDNGSFKLINNNSGLALTSPSPTTQAGLQLFQWEYQNATNQQWFFDEVNPLVSGSNYFIASRNSGKAMEVASYSTADGGNVQQWQWYATGSQKWKANSQGGAVQAFINVNSQKALEVSGYSTSDGANIQQWSWQGNNQWQKWTLEAVDNDAGGFWYKIVNVGSGKVVDVSSGSTADGANIYQYQSLSGPNQQWRFTAVN